MAGPLATGSYTWLDEKTISELDILNIPDEGEYGFMFEVDCHTPRNKMDELNEMPLCVNKRLVSPSELSKEQIDIINSIPNFKDSCFNEEWLILDFKPKKNYLLLHSTLK